MARILDVFELTNNFFRIHIYGGYCLFSGMSETKKSQFAVNFILQTAVLSSVWYDL